MNPMGFDLIWFRLVRFPQEAARSNPRPAAQVAVEG